MTKIGKLLENSFLDRFKKAYLNVYLGYEKLAIDRGRNLNDIVSVKIYKMLDGNKIIFVEDTGHGWFFAESGENIGEEDSGLFKESNYYKYNDELKAQRKSRQDIRF